MSTLSRSQLLTMLDLQDRMNSKVHPEWRTQHYAWYRAAWIECGELMDHVGYKWWKKQETDWPQVQLEVIDIWHFGLSDVITRTQSLEAAADDILSVIALHQTAELGVLEATEALACDCLSKKEFDPAKFVDLMFAAQLDFESLYTAYVGKNVLNFFRQDNGYKQGTYIKHWDGREDNEHLSDIVDSLNSSAADFSEQIYQALADRYPEAVQA